MSRREIENDSTAANDAAEAATLPSARFSEHLRPGDRVGRFTVDGELGAGGMGVVYRAHDETLERAVALKVIRPRAGGDDAELTARLLREAKAAARLSHPNVVSIYEVGAADGRDFIAMELVEGVTLKQWLASDRPPGEIYELFRQAGAGLAAAHRAGLVHRDFKPDNVLIGDGRARVADFGLARGHGEQPPPPADSPASPVDLTMTETGAIMGTPRYMAPEQRLGRRVTARSDQYSFCVALFEALYGIHPFPGDRDEPVLPPRDSQVPAGVHPVLCRGLALEPNRRFPDMTELLDALDPLLGAAVSRSRARWLAVGLALFVVVAGAAVWMTQPSDEPSAADAFSRGRAAYATGDYETALAAWKEARARSGSAGYLTHIALAEERLADYCGAAATLRDYLEQGAMPEEQTSVKARLDYLRVLCLQPTRVDREPDLAAARKHFTRAQANYHAGDYAAAARSFRDAYEAQPFPQFLFNVASSYEKLADYCAASSWFSRYLAADPGAPDRESVSQRIEVLQGECDRLTSPADGGRDGATGRQTGR